MIEYREIRRMHDPKKHPSPMNTPPPHPAVSETELPDDGRKVLAPSPETFAIFRKQGRPAPEIQFQGLSKN